MQAAFLYYCERKLHSLSQGVMQMTCQWQSFIRLIPHRLRKETEILGCQELLELRLRVGQTVQFVLMRGVAASNDKVTQEDLKFVINTATQYSPWAAATASHGYITAEGGHRIGICGDCVIHNGVAGGIRTPTSLCIRVARDFPGIAASASCKGSVLIIGTPGSGKTTLLRDLIRQRSNAGKGSIAVVDERGELFPCVQGSSCFVPGPHTDIMTGCSKKQGIEMVLRTMGPSCIAVDEITGEEDAAALLAAGWSGVDLLATAHAATVDDLYARDVYRPLVRRNLFQSLLVMNRDKTWHAERICV